MTVTTWEWLIQWANREDSKAQRHTVRAANNGGTPMRDGKETFVAHLHCAHAVRRKCRVFVPS